MESEVIKRNNVKVLGNGDKALLFIHGYGCDQNMWRFITPAFKENYKIVLIDLVGCGNSDEKAYNFTKYDTLKGYVDDVIEVCEELNLNKVTLIGHSISANIAILASIENKEMFEKLVMVCPSPRFINDDEYNGGFNRSDIDELIGNVEANYLGWSKAIAPVIVGNLDQPELAEELEESFCNNNPEIATHFAKVTFLCDNRKDLKKVSTPTLVIQSKEDNLAAVEVGEYVHANIANSELTILDTNGHCPHLSNPNETIEVIKKFVA